MMAAEEESTIVARPVWNREGLGCTPLQDIVFKQGKNLENADEI